VLLIKNLKGDSILLKLCELARVSLETLEHINKSLREDLFTLEIGIEEQKCKNIDLIDQVESSKSRVIKKDETLMAEKVKNTDLTSKYSKVPNIMAGELKTALKSRWRKVHPATVKSRWSTAMITL